MTIRILESLMKTLNDKLNVVDPGHVASLPLNFEAKFLHCDFTEKKEYRK